MMFVWRFVLVLAALMAGSALLVSCGGGDGGGGELSLDEYFRQLEEIKNTYDARSEAVGGESSGDEEDIGAFQDFLGEMETLFGEIVSDVKGLDPPAEAQDAHDGFVAALEGAEAAVEEFSEGVADLDPNSGVEALFTEVDLPAFEAAFVELEDACGELQGVADKNDIDVDLECEE